MKVSIKNLHTYLTKAINQTYRPKIFNLKINRILLDKCNGN